MTVDCIKHLNINHEKRLTQAEPLRILDSICNSEETLDYKNPNSNICKI